MSNLNTLYLNDSYGHGQELTLLDKHIIAFLTGRGNQVSNLSLYSHRSGREIFERTLSLLKTKPLLIAVVNEVYVLPITLIALSFQQACRTVVFCSKKSYLQFELLTNKNLNLYPLLDKEQIINTLKLYQL